MNIKIKIFQMIIFLYKGQRTKDKGQITKEVGEFSQGRG